MVAVYGDSFVVHSRYIRVAQQPKQLKMSTQIHHSEPVITYSLCRKHINLDVLGTALPPKCKTDHHAIQNHIFVTLSMPYLTLLKSDIFPRRNTQAETKMFQLLPLLHSNFLSLRICLCAILCLLVSSVCESQVWRLLLFRGVVMFAVRERAWKGESNDSVGQVHSHIQL